MSRHNSIPEDIKHDVLGGAVLCVLPHPPRVLHARDEGNGGSDEATGVEQGTDAVANILFGKEWCLNAYERHINELKKKDAQFVDKVAYLFNDWVEQLKRFMRYSCVCCKQNTWVGDGTTESSP